MVEDGADPYNTARNREVYAACWGQDGLPALPSLLVECARS